MCESYGACKHVYECEFMSCPDREALRNRQTSKPPSSTSSSSSTGTTTPTPTSVQTSKKHKHKGSNHRHQSDRLQQQYDAMEDAEQRQQDAGVYSDYRYCYNCYPRLY